MIIPTRSIDSIEIILNKIILTKQQQSLWRKNGFLVINNLIDNDEIKLLRTYYEDFLSGKIDTDGHRSDLSGRNMGQEKIIQIMRPSLLLKGLNKSVLHQNCLRISRLLLGADMQMDFDMLIDKSPYSNTITPWHQDQAYWIELPDKRALSCWVALDNTNVDNGCMWYIPGSHLKPLRPHQQINDSGALQCAANEEEGVPVPLSVGSVVIHHGATVHYSRGNNTKFRRRAFIINYRPQKMINFERDQGFDHLGKREIRSA